MVKTNFIIFLTISKSSRNVIDENEFDDKYGNKIKNLSIFSMSQKFTKIEYLIFNNEKTFNPLQNVFIQI